MTQDRLFDISTLRYQPKSPSVRTDIKGFVIDQQFLALLVGLVAVLLPFSMLVGQAFDVCFYDSISHFYYSRFLGSVLVAALVFIGTFLWAYRGETAQENRLASYSGWAAFGIALFPTTGAGIHGSACEAGTFSGVALVRFKVSDTAPASALSLDPASISLNSALEGEPYFQLFPDVNLFHFGSAAILFGFMAFYTFFVFTRVIPSEHIGPDGKLRREKRIRNVIYVCAGGVILASIAAILTNGLHSWFADAPWEWWTLYNATFWCEAAALWAFGLSWMVKGRFLGFLLLDPRDKAMRQQAS